MPTHADIKAALESFEEPYGAIPLADARVLAGIEGDPETPLIRLNIDLPIARYGETLRQAVGAHLADRLGAAVTPTIELTQAILSHEVQKGIRALPEVKNVIAVASGKGGVGKSTTAVSLALALQAEGAQTAVLDADIYGPSVPRMLGCPGRPDTVDGRRLVPKVSYHVQAMSIGNLVDEETPTIWRGPMATGALEQLLNDTDWKGVDYLVVDMPPGTGDIQLTLCQKIPVSGAIIVTTPQDIALLDARKALKMFEKVDVAVLGIVENMSTHVCSKCGHEEAIFGSGGGAAMAERYGVDLLGQLPLDIAIREGVDAGRPTVALEPNSKVAEAYYEIARKVAGKLARRSRDFSTRFPKIFIENG